jgi:hypothetical protein
MSSPAPRRAIVVTPSKEAPDHRGELEGPLAGMSLADLVVQIDAVNTYVNVHTDAHPGGEIRGQTASN